MTDPWFIGRPKQGIAPFSVEMGRLLRDSEIDRRVLLALREENEGGLQDVYRAIVARADLAAFAGRGLYWRGGRLSQRRMP